MIEWPLMARMDQPNRSDEVR